MIRTNVLLTKEPLVTKSNKLIMNKQVTFY